MATSEADPDALLNLQRTDRGLVVYHATSPAAAAAILATGFRDGPQRAIAEDTLELINLAGVFVSNRPLDVNEGAKGSTLLRVELAVTEDELRPFELVEESFGQEDAPTYREWCIPAALLNARSLIALEALDDV